MGKFFDTINDSHRDFILKQHIFFTASAPLSGEGHVNLSPKGMDSFRILSNTRVAYMDIVGKVQTSCGFSVPYYGYEGERTQAQQWAEKKGVEGLEIYKSQKNRVSLDGLPTPLF